MMLFKYSIGQGAGGRGEAFSIRRTAADAEGRAEILHTNLHNMHVPGTPPLPSTPAPKPKIQENADPQQM